MELTYTKIGDYYYPDLCLPPVDDDRPLGSYRFSCHSLVSYWEQKMVEATLFLASTSSNTSRASASLRG